MTPSAGRAARAALAAVVEPATESIARRVISAGPEATWRSIVSGDRRLDRDAALRRRAHGVDGTAVLARARDLGLRFVCPGDDEWPASLDDMPATLTAGDDAVAPPFGLWVRGEVSLAEWCERAIAVVGARAASPYGTRVAADLAADLTALQWTVISGAAYGVDAAAHHGALAMGGATAAVLACGLDTAYPRGHGELLERIATSGLVISELAPGMAPMRSRFLARNRIIAALTAGTVVVEAARRSGALNTARWSASLGREVLAVPGPVTSELSAGCHEWIRDRGATLVTDAREVVDAVGVLGADAAPRTAGPDRPLDAYPPDVRHVYECLPTRAPVTVAELTRTTGYGAAFVESSLQQLAAGGMVADGVDGWSRMLLAHPPLPVSADHEH
ncbi:DNA-protecting protein DprA [Actinobacteria bacterium YIM 96077]|uniref:DNA-protecting protein DprA n=1 Tax=Phytoactinopolyspora halophila TaxID=1981511 RepID=A0A329QWD7_9ACTN|nr:DNA-processing protein DprA [Phytoactinopolyspora halophila]AYY12735.1 DNA-protecting protein DprA [Actinobacteria bacterium YIM 96077]RAW16471.1 DNA-protecting protein DprA [Phytoactinopolyspora halophila]